MIECMNPLYMTHRLNDSKGNVGMTLSFFFNHTCIIRRRVDEIFQISTFYISVEKISYYQMNSVNPPSFPVDFSQCNSCVINL